MDIIAEKKGRTWTYHLVSRQFELAELKLLVDAVQTSKFITEKKSRQLIGKLETLTSVNEARQLHRQVTIAGRVKSMNESILYNVDKLHDAVDTDVKIRFQYFQWNTDKQPELRHDGAFYQVSPYIMVWDDGYYYLVAYDTPTEKLKHFRVDKMMNIQLTDLPRDGQETFAQMDVTAYSRQHFRMFGGEQMSVTLLVENSLAGIMIDRFGTDVRLNPYDDDHCTVHLNVAFSGQFMGWITGLGPGVRVIAPQEAVDAMARLARRMTEMYDGKASS